jgi:hypothetical protein
MERGWGFRRRLLKRFQRRSHRIRLANHDRIGPHEIGYALVAKRARGFEPQAPLNT